MTLPSPEHSGNTTPTSAPAPVSASPSPIPTSTPTSVSPTHARRGRIAWGLLANQKPQEQKNPAVIDAVSKAKKSLTFGFRGITRHGSGGGDSAAQSIRGQRQAQRQWQLLSQLQSQSQPQSRQSSPMNSFYISATVSHSHVGTPVAPASPVAPISPTPVATPSSLFAPWRTHFTTGITVNTDTTDSRGTTTPKSCPRYPQQQVKGGHEVVYEPFKVSLWNMFYPSKCTSNPQVSYALCVPSFFRPNIPFVLLALTGSIFDVYLIRRRSSSRSWAAAQWNTLQRSRRSSRQSNRSWPLPVT
jgi:hypothetical protein